MLLFIDNYDSYVYNLVQYVSRHRTDIRVIRNDVRLSEDELSEVERIILSPGPCGPLEAGESLRLLREMGHRVPILGICLGHQCLGHLFGMSVVRATEVVHGKASQVLHDGSRLFEGVPSPLQAGRYHSLIVEAPVSPKLRASAWLEDGTIMGLEHRSLPLFGLQFHPESVLTPHGRRIVKNFLDVDPADCSEIGASGVLGLPARAGLVDRSARVDGA